MRTIHDQPPLVMHVGPSNPCCPGPLVTDLFQQSESSFDVRAQLDDKGACYGGSPNSSTSLASSPFPLPLSPSPSPVATSKIPATATTTASSTTTTSTSIPPPLMSVLAGASSSSSSSVSVTLSLKTKNVRFHDDLDNNLVIHEVPHRSDYNKEEKKQIWYSPKEYKKLRKEGQDFAKRIREGGGKHIREENDDDDMNNNNDNDFCLLGLDRETHSYAKQRSLHKMLLQNVLDEEQKRQYYLGIKDDEAIAIKVSEFVTRCQHAKFVAGLRDNRTQRRGVIN